eukprot:scaffold1055_cov165-Amphora_coffeaeformis.AAC.14
MKVSSSLIVALSLASSASAFVQKPALSLSPSTTALGASRVGSELSGMRKIGEAALAASLFFGLLPNAVHAIDYRLPPIDRSDPNRCTLKSSAMGQSNAARDSLFDLRECKLVGADAQGYDLSGVIMGKTDVSNANFAEAYFSKGYLQDSKFDGTDFSNAIVARIASTTSSALLSRGSHRNYRSSRFKVLDSDLFRLAAASPRSELLFKLYHYLVAVECYEIRAS